MWLKKSRQTQRYNPTVVFSVALSGLNPTVKSPAAIPRYWFAFVAYLPRL